jgi:hypothetical protein
VTPDTETSVGGPELQTDEVVPNIRFDRNGRLEPDSAARAAIKSLPACPLAERLELYERHFANWLEAYESEDTQFSRLVLEAAHQPLQIFRMEITELAQALQKEMLDRKADAIQRDVAQEHARLTTNLRELRVFLRTHFEQELTDAESLNTPLLELVKQIMLKGRAKS